MSKKKCNVIDLFCGAGGLSRGFIDAGFSVKLGIDFDDVPLKTFAMNYEEPFMIQRRKKCSCDF